MSFIRPLFPAAVLAGSVLLAGSAFAQGTSTGEVTITTIVSQFEARGDTIRDIDRDDGLYEIEYTTRDGQRMEAAVDPATGKILFEKRDH